MTWGHATLHVIISHLNWAVVALQLFCGGHLRIRYTETSERAVHKNKRTDRRDRKPCELIIVCKDYSLWSQQREADRQSCLVSSHKQIQARSRCLYVDSGQNSQIQTQKYVCARVCSSSGRRCCEVDCKNSKRGREIWRRALWLTHLSASISSFPISVSLSFAHTAGHAHTHPQTWPHTCFSV